MLTDYDVKDQQWSELLAIERYFFPTDALLNIIHNKFNLSRYSLMSHMQPQSTQVSAHTLLHDVLRR